MRDELRKLSEDDYWTYGLDVGDFDYTVELAEKLVQSRRKKFKKRKEKIQAEDKVGAAEIISDLGHYSWVETQYVWHFCLWRLQAIFEGLMVHEFLQTSDRLFGLKAKLERMEERGFELQQEERSELLAWGKLRNALSHAPPEKYRPGPLKKEDVIEYKEFIKGICERWQAT